MISKPLPEYASFAYAGTMTHNQYRAALKKLGLSQRKAAPWLGIALRTSQAYALGESPIPEPVARLMRLVINLKLPLDEAAKLMTEKK